MTDQEKKKTSKIATIIAGILIFGLIIGFVVGIILWSNSGTQEMLDKGCTPKAWNQFGTPTIWSCPIK